MQTILEYVRMASQYCLLFIFAVVLLGCYPLPYGSEQPRGISVNVTAPPCAPLPAQHDSDKRSTSGNAAPNISRLQLSPLQIPGITPTMSAKGKDFYKPFGNAGNGGSAAIPARLGSGFRNGRHAESCISTSSAIASSIRPGYNRLGAKSSVLPKKIIVT